MADKKISALTGASTPLAGTEVLPIVQSGATVKVAVSDLTAGRAVSAASFQPTSATVPTNGVFLGAANSVSIATNTTEHWMVNASGNLNPVGAKGIGTALAAVAGIVSTQFTSTVAIGTAPLVVTSTTNVANLNASSLNGATFAAPGAIGGGTASAITGTTITGTDATDASSTTAAAIKTAGGIAVVKKIYVGDNIVPATAAKGINFTANTPAAGMTSQLLNWYEEGTWTPTLTSDGTPPTVTVNSRNGNYTRIGNQVTVRCAYNSGVVGGTGVFQITGLPFAASGYAMGVFAGQYTSSVGYNTVIPYVEGSVGGGKTIQFIENSSIGSYFIEGAAIGVFGGAAAWRYLTLTYLMA